MKELSNIGGHSRDARLTAVNFVADAVNRALDLKEIADNAVHGVLAVMRLDAGAVYIWQDAPHELRLFAWRGLSEAFVRQAGTISRGADATIDSVLSGDSRTIQDFQLAPPGFALSAVRAGFEAAILAPIRAQGIVVGMLVVGTYKRRRFLIEDSELIETICSQIGNALVHAQLRADLQAREEQYRALVENSDDVIFITDTDARPRFANPAFQRTLGYTVVELAALEPFERIHSDDAHAVAQAVSALIHGSPVHNLEYRFCRKDGQWIDLQCNGRVFSREGDRVKELQFIIREVTESKRRQQQLVRRNRQLAALTLLADVANSSLNIEEIARNTLEVALQTTAMDGGCIHLADAARQRLELYVHFGLSPASVAELHVLAWGAAVPGAVVATGEARMIASLAAEPAAADAEIRLQFKSMVVVPVRAKAEVLGSLTLLSRHELGFSPEAAEMIKAMGNQLGIAFANARLYEVQLRENEKLGALVDIGGETAQRMELEGLLQRILDRAARLLKADAAYMVRFLDPGDQSEVVAATRPYANLVGPRGPAAQGLSGLVRTARQGRIFAPEEVREHGFSPVLKQSDIRSVLVAPLIARGRVNGTLTLVRHTSAASEFTVKDLELIEVFASRAAGAIDNAELWKDLQHKNRLLRLLMEEAHHRIKNNLQMVSGLLQLQAETAGDGESAEHLRSANARIHAIAQVHDLLSQDMPEKVNAEQLISTVAGTLTASSGGPNDGPKAELQLDPLWLTSEQAVAVALIVNELMSNALLHGSPPAGERLRLQVSCRSDGEVVRLLVADNGGGFPPTVDWRRSKGQGMNIITQLAQVNLRGTLQINSRNGGVCAEITFDLVHPGVTIPAVTTRTG